MKKCKVCQITKPEEEFYRANGRLYASCKACELAKREKKRREAGVLPAAERRALYQASYQTPTKACTKCKTEYPRSADHFPTDPNFGDGLYPYCHVCKRQLTADYKRRNPEKAKAHAARWWQNKPQEWKDERNRRRREHRKAKKAEQNRG